TKIEITEVDGVYEGRIFSSDNDKAPIGKRLLKDAIDFRDFNLRIVISRIPNPCYGLLGIHA
ncbi:MAG: hypothetical protein AAFO02_22065, partial [Bacteroidota bacterium]